MGRLNYKPEKIIGMLREAEVKMSQGMRTGQVCRDLGISANTFYRWRKEYGGMQPDQAKKLKGLEQENSRLKKLVADLSLDNQILKGVAEGKF
jgi:transposase-like protein|tara:strand:+ start:54 stop:332 length:279 start_codon:yes stop_codon:yes gene_type:complete